jgi:hypothetical protein
MKTGFLAIIVILMGSFLLAPGLVRAQDNDWYQGRQGRWVQEQNAWRFRDKDGDEYRQQGNNWGWAKPNQVTADSDQWYQGRRGHWVHYPNGWRFRSEDGHVYRQQNNSWGWFEARGTEGNRPPGDNR